MKPNCTMTATIVLWKVSIPDVRDGGSRNTVAEITLRVENQPGFWTFMEHVRLLGAGSQALVSLPTAIVPKYEGEAKPAKRRRAKGGGM